MNKVFYPKNPLFLPNLTAYFRQSRLYLFALLWIRFAYFMITRRGEVTTFQNKDGSHIKEVIKHQYKEKFNMMYFVRGRIEGLLYPLLSIPPVRKIIKTANVLSIGPRNEGELLLLSAHGFPWKHITGVDLFSYSPKIAVMDMHALAFPDNSFDIVISSWVLRYSYSIQKAVDELVRVSKNGSYIVIGFSWADEKTDNAQQDVSSVGSKLRGGLKELFGYFGNHVDTVYWQLEDIKENHVDVEVIFKIKK